MLIENCHVDVRQGECGMVGVVKSGDENRWSSLREFVEETVDLLMSSVFSFLFPFRMVRLE